MPQETITQAQPHALPEAPFIRLRRSASRFDMTGQACVTLGHRVPSPAAGNDGVFAEWSWDGQVLTVVNDRYGIYPLFYFVRPSEICVSPSIPKLIEQGAPQVLDGSALAVFLRLGVFLGEDTPFRWVRQVPPNVRFVWNGLSLEVAGEPPAPRRQGLQRPAALDAFIEVFRRAIHRRPPRGRCGLPLSGGRDSRHILLELGAQGWLPDFVASVGPSPGLTAGDVACAGGLADALGLEQVVLSTRTHLRDELQKNRLTSFCADSHTWLLPMRELLGTRAVTTIYDGLAGDVLSNGLFLDKERHRLFGEGRFDELARELLGTGETFQRRLLRQRASRHVSRARAVERLVTELRRHASAPNPIASFHFWNRTRRMVSLCPYGVLSNVPVVFSPYIDHEVYDLLASLPADHFMDHSFHTDAIAKAYPSFAHLPYSAKGSMGGQPVSVSLQVIALASQRRSGLVRNALAIARLAAASVGLGRSSAEWSPLLVYLLQLEGALKGPLAFDAD